MMNLFYSLNDIITIIQNKQSSFIVLYFVISALAILNLLNSFRLFNKFICYKLDRTSNFNSFFAFNRVR